MNVLFLTLFLVSKSTYATTVIVPDAPFAQVVPEPLCSNGDAKAPVITLFEQWHLPPGVDTHKGPVRAQELPQLASQTAIYRQLDQWVERSASKRQPVLTVFAEGCSGPIDAMFSGQFNGWSMGDLRPLSPAQLEQTPTHVPLRLEARYGERVQTLCIDDPSEIKKGLLAFSDARAAVGYASRIQQYAADPARLKPYLSDAVKIYKLSEKSTAKQVIAQIKKELGGIVARIENSLSARNQKMVQEMVRETKRDPGTPKVFVIGGAHVADLVQKLRSAGMGCQILRPAGYPSGSELGATDLLPALKAAIQKL